MKNVFLIAVAMVAVVCGAGAQTPALTTVKDTVYSAVDGSLFSGNCRIAWQRFQSADGRPIPGGFQDITITSGALAKMVVPNAGSSPSGTSYKIDCYITGATTPQTEYWIVPASSPLATPAAPTSVTQAGTPGATTRCYFVSAIDAEGETLLGSGTCTTTSHATLDGTNYNVVATPTVTGSTACRLWRANTSTAPTAGATGLHLVSGGNVSCGSNKNDQSNTLVSATVPLVNDTDPKTLQQVRVFLAPNTTFPVVSGTLPVANGGTGLSTWPAHQLLVGNGTSKPSAVATGSAGQVLVSQGSSADPKFENVPQRGLAAADAGLPRPHCNPVRRVRCDSKQPLE